MRRVEGSAHVVFDLNAVVTNDTGFVPAFGLACRNAARTARHGFDV
jgi:hypothetical protein